MKVEAPTAGTTPVSVISPGISPVIRWNGNRRKIGARKSPEFEVFDVDRKVDRQAFPVGPVIHRAIKNWRISITSVLC